MTRDVEADDPFTRTVGKRPHSVTLTERTDKNGVVYARYVDRAGLRNGQRVNEPIGEQLTVRDAGGKLVKSRVQAALKIAEQINLRLAAQSHGLIPAHQGHRDLTLKEGFEAWLAPGTGGFPVPTKQSRQHAKAAGAVLRALGAHTLWIALTPSSMNMMWPCLFREWHLKSEERPQGAGGPAAMKDAGKALIACQNWLFKERHLSHKPMGEAEGWRNELASAVVRLTEALPTTDARRQRIMVDGDGRLRPNQARYLYEEFGAVLTALRCLELDPRIALLMTVGAETRLGPTSHCMRSSLLLEPHACAPHGRLCVPGRKNKRGGFIVFSRSERDQVDYALQDGYLRELEAAYQSGVLADYAMFPGDGMTAGTPVMDQYVEYRRSETYTPMCERALLPQYAKLDVLAGVPRKEGLGWRGARRTAADIAAELEADRDARDYMGFWWSANGTREKYYLDRERHELAVARKACELRQQVRRFAIHSHALWLDEAREAMLPARETTGSTGVPTVSGTGGIKRRPRLMRSPQAA